MSVSYLDPGETDGSMRDEACKRRLSFIGNFKAPDTPRHSPRSPPSSGNLEADIQVGAQAGYTLLWWYAICAVLFVSQR